MAIMTKVAPADATFACDKIVDKNGRVFFWSGGVYRAIPAHMASLYSNLLQSESAGRLFNAGLVRTEIAQVKMDGYEIVLRHERIPVVSYVTEWSGSMLKDAALMTLELSLELDQLNLELQDAHPWNVLFDGCCPRFIDFSSIVPAQHVPQWRAQDEFIGTFVRPLFLMSIGYASDARKSLVTKRTLRGRRVSFGDIVRILLRHADFNGLATYMSLKLPSKGTSRRDALRSLRDCVSGMDIHLNTTTWSDYCGDEVELGSFDTWMVKRKVVHDVLERTRPTTLLDVGSNTGWFSRLAAMKGAQVTAFDVDEPSINKQYRNPNTRRLGVLPLSMNFTEPTPAYGIGLRCAPATDRFRAEMVLGLAVVHHLVFKQGETFDDIVRKFSEYTNRWLLVEFIPREDKYVSKYFTAEFDWYTTDAFLATLRKRFSTVEVLPSNPEPRILVLCER